MSWKAQLARDRQHVTDSAFDATFVLVSSAVLLALGLVIAGSVEQHFEEQDMEVLTAKMERTRQALGSLSALGSVPELMGALDNALVVHHGLAVVVTGAKQRTLFFNFGMSWPKAGEVDTALRSPMTPVLWTLDGKPTARWWHRSR